MSVADKGYSLFGGAQMSRLGFTKIAEFATVLGNTVILKDHFSR